MTSREEFARPTLTRDLQNLGNVDGALDAYQEYRRAGREEVANMLRKAARQKGFKLDEFQKEHRGSKPTAAQLAEEQGGGSPVNVPQGDAGADAGAGSPGAENQVSGGVEATQPAPPPAT